LSCSISSALVIFLNRVLSFLLGWPGQQSYLHPQCSWDNRHIPPCPAHSLFAQAGLKL
jgi:hypothetical protein